MFNYYIMTDILEITRVLTSYDGPGSGFGKYKNEIVYFDSDMLPDAFFLPVEKKYLHDQKINEEYKNYEEDYELLEKYHKELLEYIENNIWCDNFNANDYIIDEIIEPTSENIITFKNYDMSFHKANYQGDNDKPFTYNYIWIYLLRNYNIYRISDTLKNNINNIDHKNFNKQNGILEQIDVICSRNTKYNYI